MRLVTEYSTRALRAAIWSVADGAMTIGDEEPINVERKTLAVEVYHL